MSVGGSKSGSNNQSQQQSTSTATLDPAIMAALQKNYAGAQTLVANSTYSPVTGAQIQGYENPYTQSVIDTTNANTEEQRQQALQGDASQAVAAHAYGGDRETVAQGITNKNYDQVESQNTAALNAANYQQALTTATGENSNENQYPILLQQLLNQSLGLEGNPVLSNSQSTGSSSGSSNSLSLSYGVKPPGT